MCSMSLTVVVMDRSKMVTMRFSISSGDRPLIGPDDADYRDIDIREDIDGHGDDGGSAQNGDEHRHDHEGIRAPERESYYPHVGLDTDGAGHHWGGWRLCPMISNPVELWDDVPWPLAAS